MAGTVKSTRVARTWLTPEQREKVVELYVGGMSSTEIAPLYGCSDKTIARVVSRAGVARKASESQLLASAKRQRPRPACGTLAAYRWHLRHREPACEPCLVANRQNNAAYRERTTGRTVQSRLSVAARVRIEDRVPYLGPAEDQASDDGEHSWVKDALCAQVDTEMFFPDKGGSTREAKSICAKCAVREECLQAALERDERYGIWGGYSERERRKLKKVATA